MLKNIFINTVCLLLNLTSSHVLLIPCLIQRSNHCGMMMYCTLTLCDATASLTMLAGSRSSVVNVFLMIAAVKCVKQACFLSLINCQYKWWDSVLWSSDKFPWFRAFSVQSTSCNYSSSECATMSCSKPCWAVFYCHQWYNDCSERTRTSLIDRWDWINWIATCLMWTSDLRD